MLTDEEIIDIRDELLPSQGEGDAAPAALRDAWLDEAYRLVVTMEHADRGPSWDHARAALLDHLRFRPAPAFAEDHEPAAWQCRVQLGDEPPTAWHAIPAHLAKAYARQPGHQVRPLYAALSARPAAPLPEPVALPVPFTAQMMCGENTALYTADQMHSHAAAVAAALAASEEPIGFLAAYELNRLRSGHDARLRSPLAGPSQLDGDVPVYAAAPLPGERTPKDYAIEHAGYLATAAQQFLDYLKGLGDVEEGVIHPDDHYADFAGGLRDAIYEFRKRLARAALSAHQPEPKP